MQPTLLHNKVRQVDCTEVVTGLVEHSRYLEGWVNQDIRLSVEGLAQGDTHRRDQAKAWKM